MRIIVHETAEAVSRYAADWIDHEITQRGDALVAAASGATPTRAYQLLAERYREQAQRFRRLRIVKLDEWGGLAMDDPASCESYLRKHLVDPLEISDERYLAFESNPVDPEVECRRVAWQLDEQGPIDICVLGLGVNGHVGFNEPGGALNPFPHVATLSPTTLGHPMLDDVQGKVACGLTLGMANILQARHVLLLVHGKHKRAALQELMTRKISTQFPASLLWLHANAICLCDRDAAPVTDAVRNSGHAEPTRRHC